MKKIMKEIEEESKTNQRIISVYPFEKEVNEEK
jgi:hypothetical protein